MGIFSKKDDNKHEVVKDSEKLFEDGLRLMKLKQYKAAIQEFKNSLKNENPKLEFDIFYNIGLCFFYIEDFKSGIYFFDKATKIEEHENKSSAYYYKGICFLKKNKSEKILLKALDAFSDDEI